MSPMHALLDNLYRSDAGRIRATLIRLLGDFDRAEEALHDAFRAALEQWPAEGLPANPVAWLVSTGRFKGIDLLRKSARAGTPLDALDEPRQGPAVDADELAQASLPDDPLRLIFICCHPALPADARADLTLREVCGLTTEEIARAFLSTSAATAQRIVRAKNKIREERLPYEVPSASELPARLGSVLQVIYLVFNEGYGEFFKTKSDDRVLAAWYAQNLGLTLEPSFGGAILRWPEDKADDKGMTVWHVAQKDSEWFSPSRSSFMINYRVDDLAGVLARLRANGVEIVKGPEAHENGKFAWVMDPDGNKVELWEPKVWAERDHQEGPP